ncbi:MAG: hypothetical protein IJO61_03740 [Oscillospiraceae bacterium]|nr:hypothetical protein [Oscillospiraceae bacterium]MBQ7120424.1 hypothetical protein [Oscillospiraceae bacterium]
MSLLIPVVFCTILFFDGKGHDRGNGRKMYIFLSVLAACASLAAAFLAGKDHIGASLSGMISIFMR